MKAPLYRSLCVSFLSIALFSGSDCPAAEAAESASLIAVAPVPIWRVVAPSGDKVELKDQDGILGIQYDVGVQTARRIQYQTFFESTVLLELQNPVAITAEQTRVVFEARGQDGSAESRTGTVFVRPVVEDEKGERFSYEPYRVADLKEGKPQDWARWTSRPFRSSEAGGASPNIYVATGGDQNAWPDGALRFIGFEIRLRCNTGGTKQGSKQGEIFVGDVRLTPTRAPKEDPSAYVDAFLKDKGHYQASFQVRPAFQANPISEFSTGVDFDPALEKTRKQRLAVPAAGQTANSWVRYRFVDSGGNIVAEGDERWESDFSPTSVSIPPSVDETTPPAIGIVRVNPGKASAGVYSPDEPLNVILRAFQAKGADAAAQAKTLKWTLKAYAYGRTLEEGEQAIAMKGKPFQDVCVKLKKPVNQSAFRWEYSLVDAAGKEIDRGSYVLGIGGPGVAIEPRHTRQGILPDRNAIKEAPYNRITFHPGNGTIKSGEEMLKRFSESLDGAREFADHVSYTIDLAEFEVLPGVYDFALLDQIMDIAADKRCGVTVRLFHAEKQTPYLWLPFTKVRDFDGSVIGGHPLYKAVSMADTSYLDTWVKAFHAIYDRYREHPGFEGYYLMLPNGEMIIPDEVWHGKIADYSWAAAEAFQAYLKNDLGLSLEQLNERWQTHFAAWKNVTPPEPDWNVGTAPDLRPQWMDFSRFKLKLVHQWSPVIARKIRTFDSKRVIIAYGSPTEFIRSPGEENFVDYAHNGGNHFLQNEGAYVNVWENGKGVGWITEPHHPHRWAAYGDPAQRGWVLDWSVFVMLSQAGGGGANLHVYYYPNTTYSMAAHYGSEYSFDRLEQYKPILRELHGLEISAPAKQVAVFHDPDTVLAKHRTTSGGRHTDLTHWFDMLTADSVPWENFTPDHEKNYKAIFMNPIDEVLSAASIEMVERTAKNGAVVVIGAHTGRYCSDAPKAVYPLLAKLGIEPPKGTYDMAPPRVVAAVDPEFQKMLGRDKIPFYSQADMSQELQDPTIWADFYRWPYRWLPQSDYFGHFSGNQLKSGEILARFADGGVALSQHQVGKGSVIIFWGTPDITPSRIKGLLGKIADNAGVVNPQAGNAIPYMLEGQDRTLGRHYALLYQETPGTYTQKLPDAPDGKWFVDDMVSGQRFGTYTGQDLRQNGISVAFQPDCPPLKVLRIYRFDGKLWVDKYRKPETEKPASVQ